MLLQCFQEAGWSLVTATTNITTTLQNATAFIQ